MLYIGIDASYTSTGLIVMDETLEIKKQQNLAFNKKGTECEERLIMVKHQLVDPIISMHYNFDIKVAIEGPSFASKGAYILQMGALNFFIRYWFKLEDVDYTVVTPGELKKFVTGKGNAKKDMMLLHVFKKWGIEFSNHDLADAYSLARYIMETPK